MQNRFGTVRKRGSSFINGPSPYTTPSRTFATRERMVAGQHLQQLLGVHLAQMREIADPAVRRALPDDPRQIVAVDAERAAVHERPRAVPSGCLVRPGAAPPGWSARCMTVGPPGDGHSPGPPGGRPRRCRAPSAAANARSIDRALLMLPRTSRKRGCRASRLTTAGTVEKPFSRPDHVLAVRQQRLGQRRPDVADAGDQRGAPSPPDPLPARERGSLRESECSPRP